MSAPNENFFRFESLLVARARAGVDFATVGGVAISLNGFVRATEVWIFLAFFAGKSSQTSRLPEKPG